VLLHGFTGSASSWEGVVDGLSARGHVPVLIDLPGHGGNRARHGPAQHTLDAALALVRDAGRWPADLVGYSMGGRIALHFAAAHGGLVRRLVLESSSPGLETAEERTARRSSDEALAERLVADGIRSFVAEWEALPLFESQAGLSLDVVARQRERRLANDPRSLAAALRGLGAGALPSLWERLPRITVPTLLVVGERDPKFVDIAARMAARMPAARTVVVPGVGHAVHLERPDLWLEVVGGFLDDEWPHRPLSKSGRTLSSGR
jgi:2-succinyl-6-hydroxy-2,4-cyclohexadiene-1-carboxylate synthase